MRSLPAVALAAALVLTDQAVGQSVDKVAQESGEWNSITWQPEQPAATDIVHIEGDFTVDFNAGNSPNFSRIYVGDSTGGLSSSNGTLVVSGGRLTVNANAAGAIIIGRGDGSTGTLNVTGGLLRGVGNLVGAGMQIGFGVQSTGSVNVSGGELQLASGVVIGYGDGSTGHFTISGGMVTVGNNEEGGSFNVGSRMLGGGASTATYRQTGGSMTVTNNYFRVGYAGAAGQMMNSTAEITGGEFHGSVLVGRQPSLKTGGGEGGTLTIGAEARISGREQAWEVSGNGKIVFVLGANDKFQPVDLNSAAVEQALIFSQNGAKIVVDGSKFRPSGLSKPIPLIVFSSGKGPNDLSQSNVEFEYAGFDARLSPELEWTDTSLQLNFKR